MVERQGSINLELGLGSILFACSTLENHPIIQELLFLEFCEVPVPFALSSILEKKNADINISCILSNRLTCCT